MLTRVSNGVYLVRSIGALGSARTPTGLALVGALLQDVDYYVGGRTAASAHHLTTQRYTSMIDVYTDRRLRSRALGVAHLVVHPLPSAGTDTGMTSTRAQDIEVRLSDPERTLIDLVDRPDRLLGWTETAALVLDHARRLDLPRLVDYAVAWPKHSTIARLGVLLSRAGIDQAQLQRLVDCLATYRGDAVLVPGGPRRGRWDPKFRVIVNDLPAASA
jgi:predicted transcriptional regulator of viral defense system